MNSAEAGTEKAVPEIQRRLRKESGETLKRRWKPTEESRTANWNDDKLKGRKRTRVTCETVVETWRGDGVFFTRRRLSWQVTVSGHHINSAIRQIIVLHSLIVHIGAVTIRDISDSHRTIRLSRVISAADPMLVKRQGFCWTTRLISADPFDRRFPRRWLAHWRPMSRHYLLQCVFKWRINDLGIRFAFSYWFLFIAIFSYQGGDWWKRLQVQVNKPGRRCRHSKAYLARHRVMMSLIYDHAHSCLTNLPVPAGYFFRGSDLRGKKQLGKMIFAFIFQLKHSIIPWQFYVVIRYLLHQLHFKNT